MNVMASKTDMQGWFKALEQTLQEARITQWSDFTSEVVKKFEEHGSDVYMFFESGKWAIIGHQRYYDDDVEVTLCNDISLHYDVAYFLSGDIVTKQIVETARKYHDELNLIAYEEKDRENYERLHRKFGNK